MEDAYRTILERIGEDPDRAGLARTPERAAEAIRYLTQGYGTDADAIIRDAVFEEEYDHMVLVRDIEFYSLCEHHLLPFFGECHVAYIPRGKVVGLSKVPRLVDALSRRLQVQERLTNQIADILVQHLHPLGVGVIIQAQHLCMMMRGVRKERASMVTSAVRGLFRTNELTRSEFTALLGVRPIRG